MKKVIWIPLLVMSCIKIHCQCIGTPGQVRWQYWDDIPFYEMGHLYVDDTYPLGPDQTSVLSSLSSPYNYNDNYGVVIKGFISVPESGNVEFNVTGDDYVNFFLSTDESQSNLAIRASVPGWSGKFEHDKYSEQTSQQVYLQKDQYYYFELHHREGGGGDHCQLYWKTHFINSVDWHLITFRYLTDVCDPLCAPKGTVCDDGDTQTIGDIEDGNCQCVGKPIDVEDGVGERGKMQIYFYPNIVEDDLDAMLQHADFPMMPSEYIVEEEGLHVRPTENNAGDGLRIEGYLTVPSNGCYNFNLTASSQSRFSLSTDALPENKNENVISLRWGVSRLNHSEPSFNGEQTMNVCLEKNQFYYFEFIQTTSSWGYHFNVFWNGPQHQDDNWHDISALYLYDYENELVCLPLGAPCDDMNSLTANDEVDENCTCVGVPCTAGIDCDDPAANFVEYDYCSVGDALGTRADDAWLSCTASPNPHLPERSGYHWIHYDLGKVFSLGGTRIWNYNVPLYTYQGFETVTVDYSIDGVNWIFHGTYVWPLASGNNTYSGFEGPNFDGETARYVMFTSFDDPNTCRGLSKVSFTALDCAQSGSPCDDNNDLTYQDVFDDACTCAGLSLAELDCETDTIHVYENVAGANIYHAVKSLVSTGEILDHEDLHYKAGVEILLDAGYSIELGNSMSVEIEPCTLPIVQVEDVSKENAQKVLHQKKGRKEYLDIYPLDGHSDQTILLSLSDGGEVTIDILDRNGDAIYDVITHEYPQFGSYYKRIQTRHLDNGLYLIRMKTPRGEYIQKMTVVN